MMFQPQELTRDHACDVTLVAEDGKKFKAHRHVLSEASPFFEKLLDSDMKESKEGVVRLEMFTESVIAATLEFIYTGSVQILTQEIAEDVIVMADYMFLPKLKTLAERVAVLDLPLNTFDCISTYHFAELYQCEELLSKARQFILGNFTTVAKTEEFLNLSSKEVEMWISSDEIDVSAEEDVFNIIITWIDCDKSERKKYFAELFRQVRLVYISRDYLCSDIVTNDFVTSNEGCLNVVEDAVMLIDSKNYNSFPVTPRKSLETPAIVACSEKHVHCYFPREDKWCRLGDGLTLHLYRNQLASPCHGKLFSVRPPYWGRRFRAPTPVQLQLFDLFSNTWTSLPYNTESTLKQIVVRNDGDIYALMAKKKFCPQCQGRKRFCEHYGELDDALITRYIPESNSWKQITSFVLGSRERICLVGKDHFIYFIGGKNYRNKFLSDVDRFDLDKNQWDKAADMQTARMLPCGAVAHGKIFIAGGNNQREVGLATCEVYSEDTNEWQFIASLGATGHMHSSMVCCDDKLYVLGGYYGCNSEGTTAAVDCYDPDKNEWSVKTKLPFDRYPDKKLGFASVCSVGIFKEFIQFTDLEIALSSSSEEIPGLSNLYLLLY